jgi:uncharacterized spore protein YtfJ
MRTKAVIDSAVEHLHTSAGLKTVYGDPVTQDGKTIIPVAKVAEGAEGAATPIGVVEVSGEETRFVPFGQTRRLAWTAAISSAFGMLLGLLMRRRRGG